MSNADILAGQRGVVRLSEAELETKLLGQRQRLAEEAARQRAELRARQERGDLTRGPWVPTTRLGQPKRAKTRPSTTVTHIRRRA